MKNGPPLWVVERGGPIEDADDESGEHDAGDSLKSQPPTQPTENGNNSVII